MEPHEHKIEIKCYDDCHSLVYQLFRTHPRVRYNDDHIIVDAVLQHDIKLYSFKNRRIFELESNSFPPPIKSITIDFIGDLFQVFVNLGEHHHSYVGNDVTLVMPNNETITVEELVHQLLKSIGWAVLYHDIPVFPSR